MNLQPGLPDLGLNRASVVLMARPGAWTSWLILSGIMLVLVGFLMTFFVKVDIEADAEGRLVPEGSVQLVDAAATGRVVRTFVKNGQHVRQGQLLFLLEDSTARAEYISAKRSLDADTLYLLRNIAESLHPKISKGSEQRGDNIVDEVTSPARLPQIDALPHLANDDILRNDSQKLDADIAVLRSQIREQKVEVAKFDALRPILDFDVNLAKQKVAMDGSLFKDGIGSKSDFIDSLKTLQGAEQSKITNAADYEESIAKLSTLYDQLFQTRASFRAEAGDKITDSFKRYVTETSALVKAEHDLAETAILSPSAGIVDRLQVTTVGQGVQQSQELMTVVPDQQPLLVKCYVKSRDAGFIKARQKVNVSSDAFPSSTYGFLGGEVYSVSSDSLSHGDMETDRSQPKPQPRENNQEADVNTDTAALFFPVIIKLNNICFRTNAYCLRSGMTVDAVIKTGRRRVIDYILSPIITLKQSALHDR